MKLLKNDNVEAIRINEKGLAVLDDIRNDIQEGKVQDVLILYRQDGHSYYVPITDTTYEASSWLLLKALLFVAAEGEEE